MKTLGEMKIRCPLKPMIVFDDETLAKVQYMIKTHDIECQWWHQVQRIEKDGHVIYFIHDLFIPPQYVGGQDVESDPEMMAQMWKQVKKDRGFKNLKEMNPTVQATTVWCHSHHKMAVSPSNTDDEQWKEQKELAAKGKNADAPQIMMIMNKRHECFNRIWDPELGLEFEKVEVRIQQSAQFNEIDEIMAERFLERPKTATVEDLKDEVKDTPGKIIKQNGHAPSCTCNVCKSNPAHSHTCNCKDCKKKVPRSM